MAELSYLVMTAADAAQYNRTHPHDIVSLNQLLEERSSSDPNTVCVGFIDKQDGNLVCNTLSKVFFPSCTYLAAVIEALVVMETCRIC